MEGLLQLGHTGRCCLECTMIVIPVVSEIKLLSWIISGLATSVWASIVLLFVALLTLLHQKGSYRTHREFCDSTKPRMFGKCSNSVVNYQPPRVQPIQRHQPPKYFLLNSFSVFQSACRRRRLLSVNRIISRFHFRRKYFSQYFFQFAYKFRSFFVRYQLKEKSINFLE